MKYKLALCAILALSSFPAYAHVTANPDNGIAGKYFQTSFRISHGCDGSDTTAVHVKLPPGFVSVKPEFKPGWKVEIIKRKLEKPVPAGHGKMTDEEFSELIWRGGPLPDAQYDEFGILVKLPEAPDTTLWFPVTQECEKGKNEWSGIPAENQQWHDLKTPAPFVKIMPDHSAHNSHAH